MAVLQQKTDSAVLSTYPLLSDSIRIGRQRDCELFLDSKDVSRYHARIFSAEGRHLIEDLDSRNGTLVNGMSIQVPVVLQDGDLIQFSSLEFFYLIHASSGDYASSGFLPSVFTLGTNSHDGHAESAPVVVKRGDRILPESSGCQPLQSETVIARVAAGGSNGGWPTLQDPANRLESVLALQNRLRTVGLSSDLLTAAVEGLLAAFESAHSVTLLMRNPDGIGFNVAAASARSADAEVMISLAAVVAAMESGDALVCFERHTAAPECSSDDAERALRYLVCAPLTSIAGAAYGAIQIESSEANPFESADAGLLAVLSHVICCHLDCSHAASSAHGRILLDRSTKTADTLRRAVGPMHPPRIEGFEVQHRVLTVPDIAADLVDTLRLSDGRLACFVLDVPGRGQPATELMAGIASVVTRALIESGSPADAIRVVEDHLGSRMREVPLVTSICIAILDRERSAVTVSVAGHCPAYHVSGESVDALMESGLTGPPLGQPRDAYQDFEICLADNDALLLCSDGIAKVAHPNGQIVPQEQIQELIVNVAKRDRDGLAARIAEQVDNLRDNVPLKDDIALLTIRKTGGRTSGTKPFRLRDDGLAS